MSKKRDIGNIALGTLIGIGCGMLFSPKNGKEIREDIKKMLEKVKELDANEVKEEFIIKINELEEGIKSLNEEKVINPAKKKAKDLKEKADELVLLSVEKGNGKIEKIARNIKVKTNNIVNKTLKKLEKNKD